MKVTGASCVAVKSRTQLRWSVVTKTEVSPVCYFEWNNMLKQKWQLQDAHLMKTGEYCTSGVPVQSTCFFALPFQCSPPAVDFDCTRAHPQPCTCPTSPFNSSQNGGQYVAAVVRDVGQLPTSVTETVGGTTTDTNKAVGSPPNWRGRRQQQQIATWVMQLTLKDRRMLLATAMKPIWAATTPTQV